MAILSVIHKGIRAADFTVCVHIAFGIFVLTAQFEYRL
jgi:hypothetical protein